MPTHEISYGQFSNSDYGSTKHVHWDKIYIVITHVIIDIVDACITCGIKSNFDGSLHVIDLSHDSILVDSTCVFALLVPLPTR